MRRLLVPFLFATLLACPKVSSADEYNLAGASTVGMLSVGLMVVDAGAAVSNAFALYNGTANKPNSYFSIGAGVVSYGLVAAAYAGTDDTELANQFAVVMGTAGTAALISGLLGLRQVSGREDSTGAMSKIRAYPTVVSDGGGHSGPGFQLKFRF